MRTERICLLLAACLLGVCGTHRAAACDTPVYRYAMYRWNPAPYEIYYFHTEPVGDGLRQRHDVWRELPYDKRPANLAVIEVDLSDEQALDRLPSDVRRHWEQSKQGDAGYVVTSPLGALIYAGDISDEQAASLANSPVRQQLAKQLSEGKMGVLVLLLGDERAEGDSEEQRQAAADAKAANQQAQQVAQELAKSVAAGKFQFYASPNETLPDAEGEGEVAEGEEEVKSQPQVGLVTVARHDPAEQWLVRSLLAVESDLASENFQREPMVFVAYGRGRVLPPYLGKGIRVENVVRDIEFISGACSCTVKEQNPGADLVMQHDWETAALALADKYGSEEGNETQFGVGDLFPQLAIPSRDTLAQGEGAAVTEPADVPVEQQPPAGRPADAQDDPQKAALPPDDAGKAAATPKDQAQRRSDGNGAAAEEPAGASADENDQEGEHGEGEHGDAQSSKVALSKTRPAASAEGREPGALDSVYVIGAGVGVALILLFGATLLVLRPR